MAQAVHTGIIDLTGEDENDASIVTTRTAFEKAFAAASRLTNHFESLKSSKPSPSISPNDTVNLGERTRSQVTSPKSLVPPRPGTLPNPVRFETNRLKKDEKKNALQRDNPPLPSPDVPSYQPALGTVASKPAKSPLLSEKAHGNKRQLGETTSVTPGADFSTLRRPRSAAISAKQNIAQTYNELEEWVNRDPNLVPRQASVSTPRKPGRPKADPDEWSPSSNSKNKVEERKGSGRFITHSPTPSAGKHGDLITKEGNALSPIRPISSSLVTKKRRLSGSPQSHDSPAKLARWNEAPNACCDYNSPKSTEPTSREDAHDGTGNSSPAGYFPRCVYRAIKAAKAEYKQSLTQDQLTAIGKSITNDIVEQGVDFFCPTSATCRKDERSETIVKFVLKTFHERALRLKSGSTVNLHAFAEYYPKGFTVPLSNDDVKASQAEEDPSTKSSIDGNDESSSKQSTTTVETNGASTDQGDAGPFGRSKPSILHMQGNTDPRLQQGFHETSGSSTSEPALSSASRGHIAFTAVLDSVVYPALKKSKKRHKGTLRKEDLDAIDKIILNEVRKRLASHIEDSCGVDEVTEKKIKVFVKKAFRQKVRKFNVLSSRNSATPAIDSRLDMATLPLRSSGLEGTTGDRPTLPGRDHPLTPGLNNSESTSLTRAVAVNGKEEAQAPRKPHPIPLGEQEPLSLQTPPNESPASSFGPNFDRGRYPALRRRRGNKFYTPTRTSKPTPRPKKSHLVHSDDQLHWERVMGPLEDPPWTGSAPAQRSNNLEVSNGKDQVRLLRTLANQKRTPHASETQLTTLNTAAQRKRVHTSQISALGVPAGTEEPTDVWPVAPEFASNCDNSKALRANSAQSHGRITDVGETPAGAREPISSHDAKSLNTLINQSNQRISRNRQWEDTGPTKEPRPMFCSTPATALDPSLEHAVAVLVTSGSPFEDGHKYSITPKNRSRLIDNQSIVNHVNLTPKAGKPNFVRIETKVIDPVRHPGRCISSLLRNRELGLSSRGRHVGTVDELRQLKSEMIEPWKSWKGASGDVVAVAWSPDSNVYAFGAAAHANIEDIQYNRPCNLLLGNLNSNQIRELPDHRVDRPKPETIPNGPNASQAVYDACDPKVYETVTSIAFSPTGDRMFTASHDCTVRIWDTSAGKHQCLRTLRHKAWVTSVEVSEHRLGLFATASKCVKDAVRIYYDHADPSCYVTYSASRAEARPGWKIYPECLRWGPNQYNSHLLLAGFQEWEQQEDLLSGGGQLCLWDANAFESIKVTPSSQSVYAAAWHPSQPFFATGGAPGNQITDKIHTKTVVRTWDVRTPKRYQVEYECPAIDMQDISFSPLNPNIVTAGCTDGISYVWDWRWPDRPIHHLKHGRPLVDLDHTRDREEADTGVMLSLWGPGGSLFYTGSSDGMIKAWDVRRHPKDVLVSNVANVGVSLQSGAFSPDGHNLLVGDAEGGIHVLSSAPCGPRSNVKSTDTYIDLVRAPDGSGLKIDQHDDNPGTEGIEAAKWLVESGQLEYHKELGVGQGLNYQGPYATYARKETVEPDIGRLRKKFEKKQPISKRGEKRWEIAIPMTTLLCERKEILDREKGGDKMALDGPTEHEPKETERSTGEKPLQTSCSSSILEGRSALGYPSTPSPVDFPARRSVGAIVADVSEDGRVEYDTISESVMVEENFWWVRMGEEEIQQARAGLVRS